MAVYTELPKNEPSPQIKYSELLDLVLKCSFLVILLSVVNLVTYYYSFNIQIINYLEMAEITSLFLNQLPNYILLFIPVVLFTCRWNIFLGIHLSVLLLIVYGITSNSNIEARWQYFMVCLVVFSPGYFYYKPYMKGSLMWQLWRNPRGKWNLFAYIFISSILSTCINSWLNAVLVKNKHLYHGTEMVLDGKMVKADTAFYYVGQTKNYIFWYNAIKKSPKIYPAGKLQEIAISTIDIEKEFDSSMCCDPLACD